MPQRYRITGKDYDTAEPVEIVISSGSIEEANSKAAQRMISVESVALVVPPIAGASPSSTPRTPIEPETLINASPQIDTRRVPPKRHRWWLLFVGLIILFATPAYPSIAMAFGLFLLFICGGVLVPQTRPLSYRLIKIDPNKPWRKGLRLTAYGTIGLFFVLFALSGFEMKAKEQRESARRAAAEAESQRLTQEANAQVLKLVQESEQDAEFGNLQAAAEKLDAAFAVPNARDLGKARNLQAKLAYARDVEQVKAVLVKLPDDQFGRILDLQELPEELLSGYSGLDKAILASIDKVKDQVVNERQKIARARLEKERIAQEAAAKAEADREAKMRAADEARRKAEAERQAKQIAAEEERRKAEELRLAAEVAQKKEAAEESQRRLDSYIALLNAADVKLIKNVSVSEVTDDVWEAKLTVDNL